MLAVEIKNLSKSFMEYRSTLDILLRRGNKVNALRGVNLEIRQGEIFGLLGPNGAGKTTLMGIISTLLLPDSGTVEILGHDVAKDPMSVKRLIGLSSAFSQFGRDLTVRDSLEIFAMQYGVSGRNITKILKDLDILKYANTRFGDLSSGNRQRATFAKSLMINPKLLLLDELTVALDPGITIKVRKMLKEWHKKYRTTIILATHNMHEADALCERIAIMHKGKIIALDTPEKLKKLAGKKNATLEDTYLKLTGEMLE